MPSNARVAQSKSNPEMTPNLQRGNVWLHSWLGLLLGWICYLIFFTGTLSFYRTELSLWSMPEAHVEAQKNLDLEPAFHYLSEHAGGIKSWSIQLPSERDSGLVVRWNAPSPQPNERSTRHAVRINPNTGEAIETRESRLFTCCIACTSSCMACRVKWVAG